MRSDTAHPDNIHARAAMRPRVFGAEGWAVQTKHVIQREREREAGPAQPDVGLRKPSAAEVEFLLRVRAEGEEYESGTLFM